MNMIRKGQLHGVAKGDVGGQVALLTKLFGVAVEIEQAGSLPPHFVFFQFFATQPLGIDLVQCTHRSEDLAPPSKLRRNASCLSRRMDCLAALRRRINTLELKRNRERRTISWQFTTNEAREKLHDLYPDLKNKLD
jgi:hypothetical protein